MTLSVDSLELSVLNSFIPPTLRLGRTMIPTAIKPIPPRYCSIERQIRIALGMRSTLPITVFPDVDKAAAVSMQELSRSSFIIR